MGFGIHEGVVRACAVVASLAVAATASGLTFTVDGPADAVDAVVGDGVCASVGGACTLRAAVMEANSAVAGAAIVLPAGIYALEIPISSSDGPEEGDLDLEAPLAGDPLIEIVGAGATTTIIDPGLLSRAFEVAVGRSASIAGVTILNGDALGLDGGAILNAGWLAVSDCEFRLNRAAHGGAIASSGVTIIGASLFSDNEADVTGGAIDQYLGQLTISDSELSGNASLTSHGGGLSVGGTVALVERSTVAGNRSAGWGGGIYSLAANLAVRSSTISGNRADSHGGGIFVWLGSTMNVYSTSILFNEADADADPAGGEGAGVYNSGSTVSVRNTIIAGNYLAGFPEFHDCFGTVGSFGRTLFTSVDSICSVVVGQGSTGYLNSLDAIAPLQSNGGPTRTHALRAGSNAIDGTLDAFGCVDQNQVPLPTDQRGLQRVLGPRCDVGSFEFDGIFSDGFESGTVAAWLPPPCLGFGDSCLPEAADCCSPLVCWNTEAGATGFQCLTLP